MINRNWRRWVVLGVLATLACLLTSCGGRAHAAEARFVGDYVWLDADRDGLQDSGEPPVEGVRATLVGLAGTPIETTRTGENGRYLFGDLPDGGYRVCFDLGDLPAGLADFQATTRNAGSDTTDSDVDPATGCTPPAVAPTDLTLDAGLAAPGNALGDFVWLDEDGNGRQDGDDRPVEGVWVVLHHEDGTPVGVAVATGPDGRYGFGNLPDGTYYVCFDLTGRQATASGVGDDPTRDSDADPATGCTAPVTVVLGHRQDFNLDLGLLGTPPASPSAPAAAPAS